MLSFVVIDGTVDHHCLTFLFTIMRIDLKLVRLICTVFSYNDLKSTLYYIYFMQNNVVVMETKIHNLNR